MCAVFVAFFSRYICLYIEAWARRRHIKCCIIIYSILYTLANTSTYIIILFVRLNLSIFLKGLTFVYLFTVQHSDTVERVIFFGQTTKKKYIYRILIYNFKTFPENVKPAKLHTESRPSDNSTKRYCISVCAYKYCGVHRSRQASKQSNSTATNNCGKFEKYEPKCQCGWIYGVVIWPRMWLLSVWKSV